MKKILVTCLLIGCASADSVQRNCVNPLIGIWTYYECTIKNTAVYGTIEFKINGTFILNIRARDDYPVRDNLRGTYRYSITGNRIRTDYRGGYGMDDYFFITGEYLYLSGSEIDTVINGPERYANNWRYKLKKGME